MATTKSTSPNPLSKKTPASAAEMPPSQLINERIAGLLDWRGAMLGRLRAIINSVSPEVVEEWKWNIPVWSCRGIICTGETYKKAVKLTFAKGASLRDPTSLFNSSLDGNVRRAVDFPEGGKVEEEALKALVRESIALNMSLTPGKTKRAT